MSRQRTTLRLMHRAVAEEVLGPGKRAILWVQGCRHHCPGCITPEGWDPRGGQLYPVEEVAKWVMEQSGIEGVTISGGEPMRQAGSLVNLLSSLRRRADLGAICYTGYVLPPRVPGSPGVTLRRTPDRRDLLALLDLLVDGPYVRERHADLLWRASDNQRLILLTQRYGRYVASRPDRTAGVICLLDEDGRPQIIGVPHRPGFREELERRLRERGVNVRR